MSHYPKYASRPANICTEVISSLRNISIMLLKLLKKELGLFQFLFCIAHILSFESKHLTLRITWPPNGNKRNHSNGAAAAQVHALVRQPVWPVTVFLTPARYSDGTAARPQARRVRAALRRWLSHYRRLPHRERGLRGGRVSQRLRQRSSPVALRLRMPNAPVDRGRAEHPKKPCEIRFAASGRTDC